MLKHEQTQFRVKYTQNYFMPTQTANRTVQTPSETQRNQKFMMVDQAREEALQHKLDAEIIRIHRAQVSGRDSYRSSHESARIKSHSTGIHNIKVVLDNPLKIIDIAATDPEKNPQTELQEPQGVNAYTPQQILSRKTLFSRERAYPFIDKAAKELSLSSNGEKYDVEYYEQLILNNPVLFRKILLAYKTSKRQMEKESKNMQVRKITLSQRKSVVKETVSESKALPRSSLNDFHPRKSENKKEIAFSQYRQFQIAVNLTNRLLVIPSADIQYRAYICRGNNGLLMKSIIKSRPWWSMRAFGELQSCNLVWTEWKKPKLINKLPKSAPQFNESPCKPMVTVLPPHKIRDYAIKSQNKKKQVEKIMGESDELWSKYQKIPHLQNYFTFAHRRVEGQFEEVLRRILPDNTYAQREVTKQTKMVNHIPGCLNLHSKKLLFLNMKNYYQALNRDIFTVIPLTYHITQGSADHQFSTFNQHFQKIARNKQKRKASNIWICKPGQNSNRGNGISVLSNLNDIKNLADQKCKQNRSLIIQRYIENPFLYNRRKFDIRCYILITTVNGIVKGYWYEQGYIRTASKEFSLKNLQNKFIHLTNDAVQKKGEEYGKFESNNKISYAQFQKYLENCGEVHPKFQDALTRMKTIATDLVLSVARKLNPNRNDYSFQLFGLDFMLDDKLNPLLIEANSNPCIEVDGSVLGKIIPALLENVIRIAVDPIFPPPLIESIRSKFYASNCFEQNKMVLIYDSYTDERGLLAPEKQNEYSDSEREQNQFDIQ